MITIIAIKNPLTLDLPAIFDGQQRRVNKLIKYQASSVLFRPGYGSQKWLKVFDRDQNLFALLQFGLQLDAYALFGYISQYGIRLANTFIRYLDFNQPFGPIIV